MNGSAKCIFVLAASASPSCSLDVHRSNGANLPLEKTARSTPVQRILVVHSYHSGYAWTAGIQKGIERALAQSEAEVGVYYMDTKRNSSEAYKKEAGKLALSMVEEWKPQVVLASDDNAQAYFTRYLNGREHVQVVFCGVNAEPEAYGFPTPNITGLLERSPFERALRLLELVAPDSRRIVFLTDKSPTSDGAIQYFQTQPSRKRVATYFQPETFAQWKKITKTIQRQNQAQAVGLYTYHTIQDDQGNTIPPQQVMAWTSEALKLPTFALFSFGVDDGALVGYVNSSYETGLKAGTWARKLLEGEPIENFPITETVPGQSMINLSTAEALGIDVDEDVIDSFDVAVAERSSRE